MLNPAAPVPHELQSTNTVSMTTTGTWFDGTQTVQVNPTSTLAPESFHSYLLYGDIRKTVNNTAPVVGDTITYTVRFDVAENVAYDTAGTGTYIQDILPDGLQFSGNYTSNTVGAGSALTLTSSGVSVDGDTNLIWSLPSGGRLEPGDRVVLSYDVLVDGSYQGSGDQQYENTQSIVNTAHFYGNIAESGNNEEWGLTDPNIINTQMHDSDTAEIIAPSPTAKKQLVEIEFPDGTIYNA